MGIETHNEKALSLCAKLFTENNFKAMFVIGTKHGEPPLIASFGAVEPGLACEFLRMMADSIEKGETPLEYIDATLDKVVISERDKIVYLKPTGNDITKENLNPDENND